ncbi:MAG: adenylosuccinate lyase [Saprospiraceae bacterium]|nr:adenylosuccinate lyase [Saprospiraceae bacterium]
MLKAVTPIDGRYHNKTIALQEYFSEYALIKYRVRVEVAYLIALIESDIPQLSALSDKKEEIKSIFSNFNDESARFIKDKEKVTNHDVKAVEYYVKNEMTKLGLDAHLEWVHFALTSQDINNTATPLMIKDYLEDIYYPELSSVIEKLKNLAAEYKGIPLLARTHGQAASPTTVGKEILVFVERVEDQLSLIKNLPIKAKFGGATGNYNAHKVSFPTVDWPAFGDKFVKDYLGLQRSQMTTQIAHYDHIAAICQNLSRINTIFIDLARDIWTYISMDYFKQKVIANEVGSSAMPHKVNPIDFENAEGNLGMANAVFAFLADKLPISRLQRDLTDSTVLRNIGVPFAHTGIAFKSLLKGLNKIILNEDKLNEDLENNWAVVAEAIQNILRREAYPKPYEALKALTRGHGKINKASIRNFINELNVPQSIKDELSAITPHNYVGYF